MGADFAGNLLYHVLPKFPGNCMKQQCKALHRHLQAWYRKKSRLFKQTHNFDSFDNSQKKCKWKLTSPKLRASAGELRSLVPWLLELAECTLDKTGSFENMVLAATKHLVSMYQCLSRDTHSPADIASNCRKILLLYVELAWRNMLLMACGNSSPNSTWPRNCVSLT